MKVNILVVLSLLFAGFACSAELPEFLTFDVKTPTGEAVKVECFKRSVRSDDCILVSWTEDGGYKQEPASALPEVRTYRGHVVGDINTPVFVFVGTDGLASVTAFRDKGYAWQVKKVKLSSVLSKSSSHKPVAPVKKVKIADAGAARLAPAPGAKILPPPATFPPEGGMQVIRMGLEVRYYYLEAAGSMADAVGRLEHDINSYDYMMARDGAVSSELSLIVVRKSEDMGRIYSENYKGQSEVKKEWLAAPFMKKLSDNWVQIYVPGGGSAGGNVDSPQKASAAGALYHEGTHNWSCAHHAYGFDTMGSSRPTVGPISIEKMLNIRKNITGDPSNKAIRPLEGDYPEPLHPYTHPDLVSTPVGKPVDIPVLANDYDSKQLKFTIDTFTQKTVKGGVVTRLPGNVLRYQPAEGYTGKDLIVYEVINEEGMRARELVFIEMINKGLTLHYSFEETEGSVIKDVSGNAHDGGIINGDMKNLSVNGIVGRGFRAYEGVILDPSRCMPPSITLGDLNTYPFDEQMEHGNHFDPMGEDYSLSFWVKLATDGRADKLYLAQKRWNSEYVRGFQLYAQQNKLRLEVCEFFGSAKIQAIAWEKYPLKAGTWNHVAMVINRSDDTVRLYVNAEEAAEVIKLQPGSLIFNGRYAATIGFNNFNEVAYDEVKLHTRVLTPQELKKEQDAVERPVSGAAPKSGEVGISTTEAVLSWATEKDCQFKFYFSKDRDAVRAGARPAFKGITESTSANLGKLGELDAATDYFWRVDKVLPNGKQVEGDIWKFTTQASVESLQEGLQAWWKFDEEAGKITRESSGDQEAVLEGDVSFVPGVSGNAINFPYEVYSDGLKKNKVMLGDKFNLPGDMTISVWIRYPDEDKSIAFKAGKTFMIYMNKRPMFKTSDINTKKKYTVRDEKNAISGKNLTDDNTWNHFVYMRRGSQILLYVNSEAVWSEILDPDFEWSPTGEIQLGNVFAGDLDEIMLWDRALEDSDLDILFSSYSKNVKVSRWENLKGKKLASLTGHSDYPDNPDTVTLGPMMSIFSDFGDSYGIMAESLFVPRVSGKYEFSSIVKKGSASLHMNLSGPDPDGSLTELIAEKAKVGKTVNLKSGKAYYLRAHFVAGEKKPADIVSLKFNFKDPEGQQHRVAYPFLRAMR